VQVAAGAVAWLDRDHHVYSLKPGEVTPRRIDVEPEPRALALADDGRLAIGGAHGLWVIDATTSKLLERPVLQLAWAPGGRKLAAQLSDQLLDLRFDAGKVTSTGSWQVLGAQAIAYVGDKLAILGFGWLRDERQEIDQHFPSGARPIDLFGARGLLVAGVTAGDIVVYDGKRRHDLHAPPGLVSLTGDPDSPFLLGIAHGQLFAWDLEETFGHALAIGDVHYADMLGQPPHSLLLQRPSQPVTFVDLATGATTTGPAMETMRTGPSPSGAAHLALDVAHTLFEMRGTALDKLADGVTNAAFVDEARIAISTARGIELYSLPTHRADVLVAGQAVDEFRPGAGWLYATAAGKLLRIELATGRTGTFERPLAPASWCLDDSGRAWIADGTRVTRWELDGSVTQHATLPSRITAMIGAVAGRIAVDTEQGGYLVELAHPDRSVATIPLGTTVEVEHGRSTTAIVAQLAPAAQLIAIPLEAGGATLVDAVDGEAWTIGQHGPDSSLAHLASDGSCLYELGDTLRVWTLALPTTREATVRWLAELTRSPAAP